MIQSVPIKLYSTNRVLFAQTLSKLQAPQRVQCSKDKSCNADLPSMPSSHPASGNPKFEHCGFQKSQISRKSNHEQTEQRDVSEGDRATSKSATSESDAAFSFPFLSCIKSDFRMNFFKIHVGKIFRNATFSVIFSTFPTVKFFLLILLLNGISLRLIHFLPLKCCGQVDLSCRLRLMTISKLFPSP